MWAYLFWTVVAAWLFSIRPKRDGLDSPRRISPAGLQASCCRGTDCGHHAVRSRQRPNANPENSTPSRGALGRTVALDDNRRQEGDGWLNSGSFETTCDTPSSESDRLLRVQREIPPHLDRSFRPSQASHVSKSNNSRSKQCQLCQDVLPDSKSLKAHLARHHSRQNGSQTDTRSSSAYSIKLAHPCRICGLAVDSHFNLQQHVAAKHPETLDHQTRLHLLKCDECGRIMDSEINLAGHKAQKHGPNTSGRSPNVNVATELCDICGTMFDDDFQLRQHKGVHHMWSLFCKQCSIQFEHTGAAMAHYSKKHGAKNVHPQRIQAFLDSLVVQEDEEEDPQRFFSCEKCGLDYSTRKELRQHYEDPFAHGAWGDQSPHFPPLIIAAPPSPPPLPAPVPMSSIDTDAQLPSFELSPSDASSASAVTQNEVVDPINPTFSLSAFDRPASPAPRTDYGAIGQPFQPQQESDPRHEVARVSSPAPSPPQSTSQRSRDSYVPEMVGDIETSVPSFRMASPGSDVDSFPPIVPGPLPAPTKAPLSAWSKPLARKGSPPSDRPLDHPKVPRYQPRGMTPDTHSSFSPSGNQSKPNQFGDHRFKYDRSRPPSEQDRSGPQLSGPSIVSPVPRPSWGERDASRSRTPSSVSDTADDSSASAGRGGRAKKRGRKSDTSSESPKRGLEPIYDATEWEVLGAPSKKAIAPVYQSVPVHCAQEDSRARWAREAEERRQITEACVAAGGEDPFGGW